MSDKEGQSEKDVDDIVAFKVRKAISDKAEQEIKAHLNQIEKDDQYEKTGLKILSILLLIFVVFGIYLTVFR